MIVPFIASDLREINSSSLAYIGDAVYELYSRCHVSLRSSSQSGKMHKMTVKYVSAQSQALAIRALEPELTEAEAAAVNSLETTFKKKTISSFNELQYFTGLTSISDGAFNGCTVGTIILPENITSIGNEAFLDCKSLTSINIPAKVRSLGQNALSGCTAMSTITVDDGNSDFCSIDGVLFNKEKTTLVQFPAAKVTAYAVPEETNTIGRDAFYMSKLKTVTLPSTIKRLEFDAFGYSKSLNELAIPEGLITIEDYILDGCSSLKTLRIPSTVTSIGEKICNGCNALTDVYSDIVSPFAITKDNFTTATYENAKLHVPFESITTYNSTAGWKEFRYILSDDKAFTLSIQSTAGGSVSYNGKRISNETQTFTVKEGSPIILTFTPDNGCVLASLNVNGANVTSSVSDGQYTISSLSTNTTISAQFSKKTYTLSIVSTGDGEVLFNNEIIKNTTQSYSVEHGASATISFAPESGCRLSTLSVNGINVLSMIEGNKYTINELNANTSVIAVFEPIPVVSYTLSIQSSAGGTVVYNGTNVTNSTQDFTVNEGATINLGLIPDTGFELSKLAINDEDVTALVTDGEYVLNNISGNAKVSASFEKRAFTLQIEASGNGKVTFNSNFVSNTTNSFQVLYGSSATMTLTPDEGNQLSSVILNGTNVTENANNGLYTIPNITGNNTVKVVFDLIPVKTYNLTIKSSTGGEITYNGASVSGSTQDFIVNEGASASLTITPDTGFELQKLVVNDKDVTEKVNGNNYEIVDISQDTKVEALFTKKAFTLSIQSSGNGNVYYGPNDIYNTTQTFSVDYDNSASIVMVPETGYQLSLLAIDGKDVTAAVTNSIYTIANITSDHVVNVVFEETPANTFTFTLDVGSGGTVTYSGVEVSASSRDFTIKEGASMVLNISPNIGYHLKSLSINNVDKTSTVVDNTFTIYEICADTSVKVEFEPMPIQHFSIDISVSEGGKVECNGMTISNDTRSFTVDEGSSITLTILQDIQYKLGKITVNNVDMTSSVNKDNITIKNITGNTSINVKFDLIMEEFTLDNVIYAIIPSNSHNVEVKAAYKKHVTIPETVEHNGITWDVTKISDEAFKANNQLVTISIPHTVETCGNNIFGGNKRLSAIIWQPQQPLTKSQAGTIANSNLLFYASSKDLAPDGVINIIVNNHAGHIELHEENDFYCPQDFTADANSPPPTFDVKTITHQKKGEIVPFASYNSTDGTHPFWLYGYDPVVGFVKAASIDANQPYIISMPNNSSYDDEYNLNGEVTFSTENATVVTSENLNPIAHGDNMFCPTFSTTTKDVNIKALNNSSYIGGSTLGSMFISDLRDVQPFEAYMTSSSGSNVSVAIFDELPTRMEMIPEKVHRKDKIKVYSTSGQMVRILENGTEDAVLRGLAPGVYVVEGKKVVVR